MKILKYTKACLVILTFIFFGDGLYGQIQFSGKIVDQEGRGIEDALISLNEDVYLTNTDSNGAFVFKMLPESVYQIYVYHPDYTEIVDSINVYTNSVHEDLTIQLYRTELHNETIILGQTENQRKKEEPIKVVVIDTRQFIEQPSSLSELMNRSPGIRIRQSGGLGNATDISINGFQGNSVQYFRDGIPLEYLGGAYNINNVPTSLLQRVEVYKGVIPVSLGADALGGAVNMVSRKDFHSYFNASYEAGSFNTHILNLTGYYLNKTGKLFAGVDFFYNYSDNDYNAEVTVTDSVTANPVPAKVRLFHNSYKQNYTEVYMGVKNRAWADELKFAFSYYVIDRASQHPALMTVPYGAVMMYNKGYVGSVRYRKDILNNQLKIDQFLTYSHINRSRVDTLQGTYDWFGVFIPRSTGIGESPRPSFSDIDFNNLISRTNLRYELNSNHHIELNLVFNYNHRLGSDPYGLRFQGTDVDVLSKNAVYSKTVAGLAYESAFLDKKLVNQFQFKSFSFYTKGIDGFLAVNTEPEDYITVSSHHWGIGDAIKYQINTRSFIRASAELTYRLPTQLELFGDNDTRAPNFELKPERSLNLNLGYNYSVQRFSVEMSAFYRKTHGMIMLIPIQPPFAQYTNLDSIRGYGFDADINYAVMKNVWLSGNFSWQENRMVNISNALYSWMNGTRLRNTPFFFANAGMNGLYTGVVTSGDSFKPYIHYNFIREFYLNHIPRDKEPNGFLGIFGQSGVPVTNLIPDQHLVNIGLVYSLPDLGWSLGVEMKNVFDEDLYDYYKIQRAGRSIHLKINYLFTHKN